MRIFVWTVIFSRLFSWRSPWRSAWCWRVWCSGSSSGRGFYRVMLILPMRYRRSSPSWCLKGLFSQNFGEINPFLEAAFGIEPDWHHQSLPLAQGDDPHRQHLARLPLR